VGGYQPHRAWEAIGGGGCPTEKAREEGGEKEKENIKKGMSGLSRGKKARQRGQKNLDKLRV